MIRLDNREVYMEYHDWQVNSYKFYKMMEVPNTETFIVHYGRIGTKGHHHTYPMHEWSKIFSNKYNKGYKIYANN